MPFDGSGTYSPPSPPVFPAVTGTTVSAAYFNATINDLASALTITFCRDGQTTMAANLPMNNYRITALGTPITGTDAASAGYLGTLLGVSTPASDLGTFTGSTIPDNVSVKAGMQALETGLETGLASQAATLALLYPRIINGGQDPALDTVARAWWMRTGAANEYVGVLRVDYTAGGTGGTSGFVTTPARISTTVNAGRTDFVWGFVSSLTNNATAGENVAIYGQAVRVADGPTWAGTLELRDTSGTANPTNAAVSLEIDNIGNGTDSNNSRIILDLVGDRQNSGGATHEIARAVRIGPAHATAAATRFKKGIELYLSDFDCGFDTSTATFSTGGPSYRLSINQFVSFTASNDRTLGYTSSGLAYKVSGATVFNASDDGIVYAQYRYRQTPVTVASLPTTSLAVGDRMFVTDATATTFASIVAGGGSSKVPVYYDGTNWRIG